MKNLINKGKILIILLLVVLLSGCMIINANKSQNTENLDKENDQETKTDELMQNENAIIEDEIITNEDISNNKNEIEEENEEYNMEYLIEIDITKNLLFVFSKDEKGDYNVAKKVFLVGIPKDLDEYINETVFLDAKKTWHTIDDNNYMSNVVRINEEIYLGSSMYSSKDINTLKRDSYEQIGEKLDFDAVIMTASDSKWIFDNLSISTAVVFKEEVVSREEYHIDKVKLNEDRMYTDPTHESINEEIDKDKYLIYIQKGSYTMTVYKQSDEGSYNYPVMNFITSVGRTIGRTPTGEFELLKKERWHEFPYPYDGGYAQYASYFHQKLMIHSPVYLTKDINTMIVDLYNEIGGMNTAGCMRTTTEAAYWIYSYCPIGTKVIISDGKPKDIKTPNLPKINLEYPNTDPTDPFKAPDYEYPISGVVEIPDTYTNSNIRSGPGLEYELVGRLLNGSKVTIIDREGEWYKINYDSKTAYIIGYYISIEEDLFEPFSENYYGCIEESNLVDIRSIIDDIDISLVFADDNNFIGKRLYDHDIAFLQKQTASKLKKAAQIFKEDGYTIKLYDAYRPYFVQEILFEKVKDPMFIADPRQASHHNRGGAVDISLVDKDGKELEFPSLIHTFDETSFSTNPDMSDKVRENLDYMINVMQECGFYNYESEWWHFSDEDWSEYPVSNYTYDDVIMYN